MKKKQGDITVEKKETLRTAHGHKLFAGLEESSFTHALELFCAKLASYKKGDSLRAMGMPFSTFGLVLCGTVQVFSFDLDGNPMMMANVGAGESFGESLAYLGTEESPVNVVAATDVSVLWLDIAAVRRAATLGDTEALALSDLPMQGMQVQSLGWEDPLEKIITTHSSVLAWEIPWKEEPGRLQSVGSQRVRHD